MIAHRLKRHRSARSIVLEYLQEEIAEHGEDGARSEPHPMAAPDEGPMSVADMLAAVRSQRVWAFVRVSTSRSDRTDVHALVHWYAAPSASDEQVVHLLAHELGHLSREIDEDDYEEEMRADSYADVAVEVSRIISSLFFRSGSSISTRPKKRSS